MCIHLIEKFTCDHCGQIIMCPEDGMFTWDIIEKSDASCRSLNRNVQIVHKPKKANVENRCDLDEMGQPKGLWLDVTDFTGPESDETFAQWNYDKVFVDSIHKKIDGAIFWNMVH